MKLNNDSFLTTELQEFLNGDSIWYVSSLTTLRERLMPQSYDSVNAVKPETKDIGIQINDEEP